tara:strand:+ start:6464 stop:7894 length:1431 start_codon:yes stop_codon:yes gene_type:complete
MENSSKDLWPVIMAGGSGSRLWPISRTTMPKQFCSIDGEETLFYKTVERATYLNSNNPLIIILNNEYKFLAIKELEKFDIQYHLIIEPIKRNTAAAIAIASRFIKRFGDNQKLLVLSSDHAVPDLQNFSKTILDVSSNIEQKSLITFGAVPNGPETGYGYIEFEESKNLIKNVKKFVEKPTKEKAKKYISNGNYLWNTGIFLFYAETILEEFQKFDKDIFKLSLDIVNLLDKKDKENIHELDQDIFSSFPDISIDYAIFEKTKLAKVSKILFNWSDLGTWPSVWKNSSNKDIGKNVLIGDVKIINSKNSLVISKHKHISCIGLENTAVIDTPDALLISSMDSIDSLKTCIDEVDQSNPSLVSEHRKVYRPWGWYDSIERGSSHQVKRIHVYPSQKLSVQRHKHRAERWVVIKGIATVTLDDKDYEYKVGEVVQINVMQIHSLANYTKDDLEIIEVQLGDYLGEDDIERFEDIYGRT